MYRLTEFQIKNLLRDYPEFSIVLKMIKEDLGYDFDLENVTVFNKKYPKHSIHYYSRLIEESMVDVTGWKISTK